MSCPIVTDVEVHPTWSLQVLMLIALFKSKHYQRVKRLCKLQYLFELKWDLHVSIAISVCISGRESNTSKCAKGKCNCRNRNRFDQQNFQKKRDPFPWVKTITVYFITINYLHMLLFPFVYKDLNYPLATLSVYLPTCLPTYLPTYVASARAGCLVSVLCDWVR